MYACMHYTENIHMCLHNVVFEFQTNIWISYLNFESIFCSAVVQFSYMYVFMHACTCIIYAYMNTTHSCMYIRHTRIYVCIIKVFVVIFGGLIKVLKKWLAKPQASMSRLRYRHPVSHICKHTSNVFVLRL